MTVSVRPTWKESAARTDFMERTLELARTYDVEEDKGLEIWPNESIPIPPLSEAKKAALSSLLWKTTHIDDTHEKHDERLFDAGQYLEVDARYFNDGREGAYPTAHLRFYPLVQMILMNNVLKKHGFQALLWDGWRSSTTQMDLFDEHADDLRDGHPEWGPEQIRASAQKFVSIATGHPFHPSPHVTGGAIDWTLADLDRNPVNMGCAFDDFSDVAATRYFEELATRRSLTPEEQVAQRNRRIHYRVSTNLGFANYPAEFWHSSLGDQMWGLDHDKDAFYGPAPFATAEKLLGPRTISVNRAGQIEVYQLLIRRLSNPFDAIHAVQTAIRALYVADGVDSPVGLTPKQIRDVIGQATGYSSKLLAD